MSRSGLASTQDVICSHSPVIGVFACAPVMRSPSFLIVSLALLFKQRRRGSRNARGWNLFLRTERNRELERGQRLRILGFGLDDVPEDVLSCRVFEWLEQAQRGKSPR
jgi:hypothetical protein